jgi:drug/metabolite transporter (DMT)-like permease
VRTKQQQTALGLAYALGGFALLSVGDAIVKTVAGAWPGTAIATLRYIIGAVGLCGLLWWREGRGAFTFPDRAIHFARGFCVAAGSCCFFIAVGYMPLAEATVISFANPVFVALLSAAFLGERASRATWIATALAFAGVLIVIRPNFGSVGWVGLLPLATAFFMAVMVTLNRRVAGRASALKMQVLISATAVPILLSFALAGHFSGLERLHIGMPSGSVVMKCAIVACSASAAHGLLYKATELVSAATMAPVTYVQMLVALVLGYALFGNVPDGIALAGSALIVMAGLYLWHAGREVR